MYWSRISNNFGFHLNQDNLTFKFIKSGMKSNSSFQFLTSNKSCVIFSLAPSPLDNCPWFVFLSDTQRTWSDTAPMSYFAILWQCHAYHIRLLPLKLQTLGTRYDLNPITVRYHEDRPPIYHFLTTVSIVLKFIITTSPMFRRPSGLYSISWPQAFLCKHVGSKRFRTSSPTWESLS